MDANQNQLNNALGQVQAAASVVQVENQKQVQAEIEQYNQQRLMPGNENVKTGGFNLYGNGQNIPNGPVWLGQ